MERKIQIKQKRNMGKGLILCGASLLIFALIFIIAVPSDMLEGSGSLGYMVPILLSVIGLLCMVLSIPTSRVQKKYQKNLIEE
ncbi:MAG: hypothetical protein ACW98X_07370 [Promethearchaeota archaeon]|jgi:hypothetical protein